MADRNYRPPRTQFGLGPLPGTEQPMLPENVQRRFKQAGSEAFLPYVNPWETVARAQDYRQMGNQLEMADAEERFIQQVQQNPETGLEKFIAQDPRLVMSPMFRAYAITKDRLRQEPKKDPYAIAAAEAGTEVYKSYQDDLGKGIPPLEAFAKAQDLAASKKTIKNDSPTLSGAPKEKFDAILDELSTAQELSSREPTEEEKRAFLPEKKTWLGRKDNDAQYSKEEWDAARLAAKESSGVKEKEALKKLESFQRTYGDFYKVDGGRRPAPARAAAPADAPQNAWPVDAPTTFGTPQNAPQAAPEAPQEEVINETVIEQPSRPRDDQAEALWNQYIELENSTRVDAKSTNPTDLQADRELRGEMKGVKAELMKRMGLPDTKDGNNLFQNLWQGRKNSLTKSGDSRGEMLKASPIEKKGATGNSWVIRPA